MLDVITLVVLAIVLTVLIAMVVEGCGGMMTNRLQEEADEDAAWERAVRGGRMQDR